MDLKRYFRKDLEHGDSYASRAVFRFLNDAAEFCENGVILDAGAGRQRYKPFFEKALYLAQEYEVGIKFKDMGAINYDLVSPLDKKIPLKDNCLDGILSTSVIEHIRYPERFISEAFRVLKPGGKLFIHVPFVHNEHETPYDFNRPTRYGIERWFTDSGFKIYDIRPTSSATEMACGLLWLGTSQDIGYGIEKKNIFLGKFLKIVYYCFCKLFCWFSRLLVDRGPKPWTNITVSWIAVATKPGTHIKEKELPRKENFLKEFKIQS
jgi:SAM-dependent methyltransferase